MATNRYCVGSFQTSPVNPEQCVPACPRDKGFELVNEGGQLVCRYLADTSVKYNIQPVMAVTTRTQGGDRLTLEELQSVDPQLYADYQNQQRAATTALTNTLANLGQERQLADAFRRLQEMENIRDRDPQAYQDARVAYYTLKNGEGWREEEAARIAGAEVGPQKAEYRRVLSETLERKSETDRVLEAVKGVKDNVITMRDMFETQVKRLKDAVLIEKKNRMSDAIEHWTLLDGLLNVVIGVIAVLAVLVVGYKIYSRFYSSSSSYSSGYSYSR